MRSYNFSKINNREKRFYSFSDVSISKTGIPTKLIAIAAVLLMISMIINVPIGLAINNWYFSILTENGINTNGIMIVYGIPIGIACSLYYIRVFNYRLIDLIFLYLKPKREINIAGKRIVHEKVLIDAFLERN